MDPLIDPRCLVDTESIAIDGADGVCRAPRLGAARGLGVEALLVLSVAVLAFAWFARPAPARATRFALALTLLLGVLPGAYAVLAVRADRPTAVWTSARHITRLHDAVRAYAAREGCGWIRTASCLACVETAELALVGLTCPSDTSAHPIDLFSDALESGCAEADGSLRCGTVDDDHAIEGGVPMTRDPFAPEGESP